MSMINSPYQYNSSFMELNQRIDRLERDLRRLERKVVNLEHKNPRPLVSNPNYDSTDNSGLYMV